MSRRDAMFPVAGIIILLLAVLMFGLPQSAPAQDSSENRIDALETQVAELEDRVDALETDSPGKAGGEGNAGATSSEDAIVVEGSGKVVTESFELPPGRYKVTATVEVEDFDVFTVTVYLGRDESSLFIEFIDEPGTWTGSVVFETNTGGSGFLEVDTGSDWSIEFTPLET